MKIYTYAKCSTCRDAVKLIGQKKVEAREIPIRETPPSLRELKQMLARYDGNIRRLFNTSGLEYKRLGLSEKLPSMNTEEALNLLSTNGSLIKRPFLIKSTGEGLVGFKKEEWEKFLS